ncbi:response regulator transcription factor [Pseudomonas aeruginosa]|uniref:response regulator transcription factor n=1 Tax=Pseudomonas aeruginosa TaxID=287 RepID=UPI001067479D|nr:response regulator transcription factor [Pseudomonas aeruginosa]TEN27415.1 response regulator transcription factor [Pseudomonas aeruginosa]
MLPSLTPDPRLLAIEDDPTLGAHLFQHLNGSGFEVTWCRDGEEGLAAARSGAYDLILMDIMLPGRDGLEILRQLRQEQALPVILMSALGAEQDRIAGFSQGAEGGGGAPGRCAEPLARPSLQFSADVCDVSLGERFAGLTPTEYRLLETFLAAEGETLTKAFLYQHVLHRGHTQHDRSLDMHVSHLRRKLQRLGYAGHQLHTVWGKGYVLTPAP